MILKGEFPLSVLIHYDMLFLSGESESELFSAEDIFVEADSEENRSLTSAEARTMRPHSASQIIDTSWYDIDQSFDALVKIVHQLDDLGEDESSSLKDVFAPLFELLNTSDFVRLSDLLKKKIIKQIQELQRLRLECAKQSKLFSYKKNF
jgi:hypothetical protein